MNRDIVEHIPRDYDALRRSDADPELEAVRVAIMLEDVFGIALSDAEIDPVVLAGSAAVAALVARLPTLLRGVSRSSIGMSSISPTRCRRGKNCSAWRKSISSSRPSPTSCQTTSCTARSSPTGTGRCELLHAGPLAWFEGVMAERAITAAGVFEPSLVAGLLAKCSERAERT